MCDPPGADPPESDGDLIDRLREALDWAVGFIRCNLPRTSADYPDMRNAEHLVAGHPLYSGEFHRMTIRAELAEEEVARLSARVAELERERTRFLQSRQKGQS
jgi:hypothetical protein